jgi:hypothetical protein
MVVVSTAVFVVSTRILAEPFLILAQCAYKMAGPA